MEVCSFQEAMIKWVITPFIILMLPLSAMEQRPFFVIMGVWSLYLILYPLTRGSNPKVSVMFLGASLLAFPFLLYLLHVSGVISWDLLLRATEISMIYAVGLFTFLHLVTYQGMLLERISILFLCSVSTISMGMLLVVGQYLNNILFGTTFINTNQVLMDDLVLTFVGAVIMSIILLAYMRWKGIMVIGSMENDEEASV